MKTIHLVWLITALILIDLLLIVLSQQSVPNSIPHTNVPSMQQATDGLLRLQYISTYGYWLQNLTLALALSLVLLSIRAEKRTAGFWLAFYICAIIIFATWAMIFTEHQRFLKEGVTNYFAGFPIATAWMFYGTWLSFATLAVLYVVGFRQFIYSEKDERDFQQLVADCKQKSSTHLSE